MGLLGLFKGLFSLVLSFSAVMARKTKPIIDQIAELAEQDQAIVTFTVGGKAWRLPVMGNVKVAGDLAYIDLPALGGLYHHENGNLAKANSTQAGMAEEAFFPDRAEKLKQLQALAKEFGFNLSREEGSDLPTRTRAPKGQGKPKVAPRGLPEVGKVFTYTKDGLEYKLEDIREENGKKVLVMAGDETKLVNMSAVFWRYWTEK
jgi:hypothetical protein